jgi:hypothetical protein
VLRLSHEKEGNVNDFFYLFVAELFVIAAMWHNKLARSGMERESERPDPAVLFSCVRPSKQKANEQHQSAPTVHSPQDEQAAGAFAQADTKPRQSGASLATENNTASL